MAIALTFGAIVNLMLAWFFMWSQWVPQDPTVHEPSQYLWNRYAQVNAQHGPATIQLTSGAVGCDFIILGADPIGAVPRSPPRMMVSRAGFPMRAFEGMHSWGNVKPPYSWSIPVRAFRPNVSWVSALPFRPMWPGFFVDTALYASLIWIVIFGPTKALGRARRRWRIAQKRCPDCGYALFDALSAGCPECGWRRGPDRSPQAYKPSSPKPAV